MHWIVMKDAKIMMIYSEDGLFYFFFGADISLDMQNTKSLLTELLR